MWSYDPMTRCTRDSNGLIPRVKLEETAERLFVAGTRNQLELVDVLKSLTGLSRDEIRFNVGLMLQSMERGEHDMRLTKEQYQKAKDSLPKLRKAEQLVQTWENAVEGERREVTSVNVEGSEVELTYRKEVRRDDAAA